MSDNGEVQVQPMSPEPSSDADPEQPMVRRRAASDLRAIAMMCHKQISKDVWGKKDPNSFVDHLRPQDVEAFALDVALRTYWDLLRQQDDFAQCSLSSEGTTQLRAIILEILQEHQESLTREHTFEVPDPVIQKEREEEKQKQIEASREQTKQRREALQKEREERKARMEAKRKAAAAASTEDAPTSPSPSSSPTPSSRAISAKDKPKPKITNTIKIQSPPRRLAERTTPTTVEMLKGERKTFVRPTLTRPAAKDSLQTRKITISQSTPSSSSSDPAPEASTPSAEQKDSPPANRSPNKIVPGKSVVIQPPSGESKATSSSSDRSANAMRAFQKLGGSKREKTFKRPPLNKGESEPDPVPMIKLKRTLVNTEKLVPLIQQTISERFTRLCQGTPTAPSPLDFFHFSTKGPRTQNEDELAVVEHLNEYVGMDAPDRWSYFGTYDGHCGKYTSLFVRSQIHYKVCRHQDFPDDLDKAIHDSILEVDQVVNDVQEREEFACGSTVLSVWVRNQRELIVGNVGDCRGFICRNREPVEIAVPHHPDREDERERIVNSGGAVVRQGPWRVNGILAVSRSVGDNNLKKFVIPDPEITRFELQEEDEFVILASDGLWDVIKPSQMIDIVQNTCETEGRKYVCRALCEAALENGSKDNVTVLLMFVNRSSGAEE